MKKTAYIVSIKYAPGSHKEFVLIGRNLRRSGMEVKYLLSKDYMWMHKEPHEASCFFTKSSNSLTMLIDSFNFFLWKWICLAVLFKKQRPEFLCVYNPHPVNFAIVRLAKCFCPDGIRAVYLHEPGKTDKKVYGFKGCIFFKIVEFCDIKVWIC